MSSPKDENRFYYFEPAKDQLYTSKALGANDNASSKLSFFDFELNLLHEKKLGAPQALDTWPISRTLPDTPKLSFKRDSFESFQRDFEFLQESFKQGEVKKAVPVNFLRSGQVFNDSIVDSLRNSFFEQCKGTHSLFFQTKNFLYIGFSPEVLFVRSGDMLKTVALAGTKKWQEGFDEEAFLNDPKESREHQFVVESIVEDLSVFGEVETGNTYVARIGGICHLKTDIKLALTIPVSNRELMTKLHPTPALGVYPKGSLPDWMKQHSLSTDRRSFGAPVLMETGANCKCIVGIRCLVYDNSQWRVGAGCGIVAESILKSEWAEIKLKQNSVLEKLGETCVD